MLHKLCAATVAALLLGTPGLGEAQRAIPVFVSSRTGQVVPPFREMRGTRRTRALAVDSNAVRDKTPYVLGGAILGGIAGGLLYRRELEKLDGVDYTFPSSVAISVGAGAALGALLGYVVGSFGDPPAKRESGYHPSAPIQR